MNTHTTLLLIDGSAYLFRAFHALPALTNSKGNPTGAAYGMTNMLKSLLAEYQPQYAAVVFDTAEPTFRTELYPAYKANREAMPEELAQQIEATHKMIQALGFPLLMKDGFEADDLIGTLAKQAEASQMQVLIFSGDKDLAQLVNPNITLIDPMKQTRLDEAGVQEKFGVTPAQIHDYLSLIGDTVDNVPGVAKVGPKTAVKWLETYGSLANLIEHAAEIKGKVGDNLRTAIAETLPLTQKLIELDCAVELSVTPTDLTVQAADNTQLRALYSELEFKNWLRELLAEQQAEDKAALTTEEKPDKATDYQTILTEAAFQVWLEKLQKAELFAFDTETTSLNYLEAELVGLSVAISPYQAAYIPVAHNYMGAPPQLARDWVLNALKPLLESPNALKVGHNLKYDAHVLANYDITLRGIAYDSMLESYLLDSTARHDMDSLALKYLNVKTTSFTDIAGKGAKQLTFNQIELERAAPYAAEDADITLRLHQHLWPKLASRLAELLQHMEFPLITVLQQMERAGVNINANLLKQQSQTLAEQMQTLEKKAHEVAGKPFNLNSPKQLQTILYEELKLPILQKTPKGQPSTAESVLQELANDYELPALILEYRSLSKLKSTYTDALPKQIHPKTGRVHTSYQQAVASTGRLSSTEPNLQNIPIRSEAGRRIRQAFTAPVGYQLLAADYSQIELRIMAHLSEDENLRRAFAEGADIHRATAAEVFTTPLAQVTQDQRRSAKAINFGLIYGMSAFGLAKQLKIGRNEAQNYVDAYFARYPGVKKYMDNAQQQAREQGYVETVFGRRLYIAEINSRNAQRRQYAERTAINAPMQGTAADIIKMAMLNVHAWLSENPTLGIKMIMQVHDELVFEVAEAALSTAREKIPALMSAEISALAQLSVPLLVEVGVGNNWEEAH